MFQLFSKCHMLLFKIQLIIDVLSLFVNCLIQSESWTTYDQLCIEKLKMAMPMSGHTAQIYN